MAPREWICRRAFDNGVDSWKVNEALPEPALRALVSRHVDYSEETRSFNARQELATTSGVMIYALGGPLEIIGADGEAIVLREGEGFAGGISDATSISRGEGAQAGVQVFMSLDSLTAIIGVPLAELANRVATMRDLIGTASDELGARLLEAEGPEQRFTILDEFLARRFAAASDYDRTIRWSMTRLAQARGPSSSDLAEEIGWSRRHFARRFRDVTGFGPDRFRRIGRFQQFVKRLTESPDDVLAGLAVDCGYVDQSHLSYDVRDFADLTPGELRARLIPEGGGVRDEPVPTLQDQAALTA